MTGLRPEELQALGLDANELSELLAELPEIQAEVWSGTGTAALHVVDFQATVASRFGLVLKPGILNLRAADPVVLPRPLRLPSAGHWMAVDGLASPAVLNESALAFVVQRDLNEPPSRQFEAYAHTWLRVRLGGLKDGDVVGVKLIPGDLLQG